MSWSVFLGVCAAMLVFAFLVWLGGVQDDRRWKRQQEEADAARRAAAE